MTTFVRKFFLPALLLVFFSLGLYLAKNTSATIDEAIFHITDGYTTLKTHDYRLNPVSPAFARQWVAMPLLFLDLKLDLTGRAWKEADSSEFGEKFIYLDNRDQALLILFLSRLMNLVLGAALVAVVFWWAFQLYGFFAAVIASALTAFTPSILAHSAIAATDLPVAFWSVLFLFCLWQWARGAGSRWFLFLILSLGLAQSSKFTALFFYPVLGIILWREKGFKKAVWYFMWIFMGSMLVVWATYFFEWKPLLQNVPRVDEKLQMIRAISARLFPDNTAISDWLKNAALNLPIPLPSYLLGIAGVVRGYPDGYMHYFNGQWTKDVYWFYYVVIFLVKMTPAFLLLLLLRTAVSIKERLDRKIYFYTLLPTAVFFLMTLKDPTAVGMRYILVTVPLLAICIGGLAAISVTPEKVWKYLLMGLVFLQVAVFARIYPYCLDYFNLLVDGTANAYHYFRGSDVDWGQGLVYLKKYLDRNGIQQKVVLQSFGSADPSLYGIDYRAPVEGEMMKPGNEIYAVSVQQLESFKWTATKRPDEKLGSAIFVYDFRDKNKLAGGSA